MSISPWSKTLKIAVFLLSTARPPTTYSLFTFMLFNKTQIYRWGEKKKDLVRRVIIHLKIYHSCSLSGYQELLNSLLSRCILEEQEADINMLENLNTNEINSC